VPALHPEYEERTLSIITPNGSVDQATLAQLYESNVVSRDGVRVGTVIDLVRQNGEVTGFEVSGGGMFGVGAGHFSLPVNAIVRIEDLDVHVDRHSRELS
jgi:sporulation protein YlmC with PRC-barrel domain